MPWYITLLLAFFSLAMFGFAFWLGWQFRGLQKDILLLNKKERLEPWERDPDEWKNEDEI